MVFKNFHDNQSLVKHNLEDELVILKHIVLNLYLHSFLCFLSAKKSNIQEGYSYTLAR